MTDDEIRARLADALIADLRTRGFVGIRAVTEVLAPVVREIANDIEVQRGYITTRESQ